MTSLTTEVRHDLPDTDRPLRVLYSFPHKLGGTRVDNLAWQQVRGLAAAGANVLVCPGAVYEPVVGHNVTTHPTLAFGKIRIPYRLLGTMKACMLHDALVARRLRTSYREVEIVHTWPLGALETLKTAARLGIPAVLERPNAHTRFAYGAVQRECQRLGITLPSSMPHAFRKDVLEREEQEYQLAYRLLCPSEFTASTFLDAGFPDEKLARHQYGYDPRLFFPDETAQPRKNGIKVLFAGVCAVRKGLHFALEAWLKSPASRAGSFLIAGEFLPDYKKKLAAMLSHPSIRVLGHRSDVPELMRTSDVLVLPSIEEGFALVCVEAMASGCVPLVSKVCTEFCRHMENALVHEVADVDALEQHFTLLHQQPGLLARLREAGLAISPQTTWQVAGAKLLDVYKKVIWSYRQELFGTEISSCTAISRETVSLGSAGLNRGGDCGQ